MTRTTLFWLAAMGFTAAAAAAGVRAQDIQTPAPAVAPGTSGQAAGDDGSSSLVRVDRNRDGSVTKAEARADPELARRFTELDTNNSGELDSGEFARFEVNDVPEETR